MKESMNDLPREKLRELIVRFSPSLCDEPQRCEALLRDFCAGQKREIHVLVNALRERVAADLLASRAGMPYEVQFGRLAKRLRDNLGLSDDAARWAVESWAFALGVIVRPQDSNAGGEKAARQNNRSASKNRKTASTQSDRRSKTVDAKKPEISTVRVNDTRAGSGMSVESETNEKSSQEKKFTNQTGADLFPLYGVTLGKTTVQELARLGKRTTSIEKRTGAPYNCYVIQGNDFWFNESNIANHMYIARGIQPIPQPWQAMGFNWTLSYDGWIKLLRRLGYWTTVEKTPRIVKYSGHDSFSASVSATKEATPRIKIELDFNYSTGTREDSEGTLYYIRVTSSSQASSVPSAESRPSSDRSDSHAVASKAPEEKQHKSSSETGQSGNNKLLQAIGIILMIPLTLFGGMGLLIAAALVVVAPVFLLLRVFGLDYNHLGGTAQGLLGAVLIIVIYFVAAFLYSAVVSVWNGFKAKLRTFFQLQQQ